jgi:hypothetical protein
MPKREFRLSLMRSSNAKKVSIMAISAALYASLFGLSFVVTLPGFTLLYLPIILLGVFPIWFGWSGLVGSMIGALIGGVFVENLAWFAWVEMITTLIIYGLNWLLLNRKAVEAKTKVGLLSLLGVYAFTLFVGLGYILWQETFFPQLWLPEDVIPVLVPTFTLNFVIAVLICPALVRTISPKMRNWGIYSGTFWERRTQTAKASIEH